jgi:hypothetical protein
MAPRPRLFRAVGEWESVRYVTDISTLDTVT